MPNPLRKIQSVWKLLCRGDFITIFNDICRVSGLVRFFYLGENKFFTILPFERCKQLSEQYDGEGNRDNDGFQLSAENDKAIIPELLLCMEGSNDYSYMTTDEISAHFHELLEQGSTVWILRDGTKIVGFFWTTCNEYLMSCGRRKLRISLPKNAVFIEFIFINCNYRRRGLYSYMFHGVYRLMPDLYFSCMIDSYNTASIAVHRKLGFHVAGQALYFIFLPWNFKHWVTFRLEKTRKLLFCPKENKPYPIRVRYE